MLLMQVFLPRFVVLGMVLLIHINHLVYAKRLGRRSESDDDGCSVNVADFNARWLPLLLHKSGTDFLFPTGDSQDTDGNDQPILRVEKDDTLTASCAGNRFRNEDLESLTFKCSSGRELTRNGVTLSDLSDLSCSKSIQESVVDQTLSNCGPEGEGGKFVEVGWPSGENGNSFLAQFSVCHSKMKSHSFYSSHVLHGEGLQLRSGDNQRPSNFKEGKGFFPGISANTAYSVKSQEKVFQQFLDSNLTSNYFSSQKFFLAKGHLSPDADFPYKEMQDATYYFFNVAPQWQSFNNGNWKSVEGLVRKYAEANKRMLNIFTGTHGHLKLLNHDGISLPVSLGPENSIPVPNLIWKLVHDPLNNNAIVFVGVNNPHKSAADISTSSEDILCHQENDICSSLGWIFSKKNDVTKGYLYCCTYQSIQSSIDWLPVLDSPGNLVYEDPTRRTSPRKRPSRESEIKNLCQLNMKMNTDGQKLRFPPIFYSDTGDILTPIPASLDDSNNTHFHSEKKVIVIENKKVLTVACPGNKLSMTGGVSERLLCHDGNLQSVDLDGAHLQNEIKYSDLGCAKSVQETLHETNRKCGPHEKLGVIVEIGWTLYGSFKPMIRICHDVNSEHTFFAFHELIGKSLPVIDRDHKRPGSFQEGRSFYRLTKANLLYKQKTQEKNFERLGLSRYFDKKKDVVLNRGHLAPNGDFIMKEWQDATFYLLNTAPQWKKINGGNWLNVEAEIRGFAQHFQKTLGIYTGTHGILRLKNNLGVLKEVYLDERSLIPVPLYFWKIVHDKSINQAIVFVTVNSPEELSIVPPEYQLCPDICAATHWHFTFKDDFNRGLLYCCSYNEFKKSIPWVNFLNNPGVLES